MGFIYSDLMVPPLDHINAKYYGWKVALYIAAIMFASIVATALILNTFFSLLGLLPESAKAVEEITQFKIDYTFFMNILFILVVCWMLFLNHQHKKQHKEMQMDMEGGGVIKKAVVTLFIGINVLGVGAYLYAQMQ